MRQIWHDTCANGISDKKKNNRNGGGRFPSGYGTRCGVGDNRIQLQTSQFGGQVSKSLHLAARPSSFEEYVTPFSVAKFAQPIAHCVAHSSFRRAGQQKPERAYLFKWLLSARRTR